MTVAASEPACVAAAVRGITDDYMTSEAHHPGYVLIPTERFDMLREAEAAIASAPAGDGVEAWHVAYQLLATATGTNADRHATAVNRLMDRETVSTDAALEAIEAALARPRAAVGEREACKECGGSSLFWFVHYHNRSQVVEGRLRTGDVECLFVLGCEECSATQRAATTDEVATILALQVLPAKMGSGWVPQIGERVEVTDDTPDAADWRALSLWVAGVRVHDSGDGLDVTVSEQWPIPSRVSGRYIGQTDDFRVGATRGPDMLRPLQPPHTKEA